MKPLHHDADGPASMLRRLGFLLPVLFTACGLDDTPRSELVDPPPAVGSSFGRMIHSYVPLILEEARRAGYHPGVSDDPEDPRGASSIFIPRVPRADRARGFFSGDLTLTLHAHDPGTDSISSMEIFFLEFVRVPRDTTWYLLTEDESPAGNGESRLPAELRTTISDLFPHALELAEYDEMRGS